MKGGVPAGARPIRAKGETVLGCAEYGPGGGANFSGLREGSGSP